MGLLSGQPRHPGNLSPTQMDLDRRNRAQAAPTELGFDLKRKWSTNSLILKEAASEQYFRSKRQSSRCSLNSIPWIEMQSRQGRPDCRNEIEIGESPIGAACCICKSDVSQRITSPPGSNFRKSRLQSKRYHILGRNHIPGRHDSGRTRQMEIVD